MKYEQDILKVLYEAGDDGLSVKKIVRHVYNANNSLFGETTYDDVYKAVTAYIQKCKKNKDNTVESTGQWGFYRLNTSSKTSCQLMLEFTENKEDSEEKQAESTDNDNSLSLF